MRLSQDQIRAGILHPDKEVRTTAVFFFADSFSNDRTIMPLAVQAVEQHGWKDAFDAYSFLAKLAQSDETIHWALDHIKQLGPSKSEDEANLLMHLGRLVAHADPAFLLEHEAAINDAHGIDPDIHKAVRERIRLRSLDAQACWHELVAFCEQHKKAQYLNDIDIPHANRLVEAIARDQTFGSRAMSILAEPITDFTDNPMVWMEGFTVRLAGELKLEAAVPLIVEKLHEEGDWLNEECVQALTKIGTESVVEAIADDYPNGDWGFRLCASCILENIHSDAKVLACLDLLEYATDAFDTGNLCRAMLRSCASEAIEPTRQLILDTPLDPDLTEVRSELLTACTLMGETFPEFEAWTKAAKNDVAFRRQWYADHRGTVRQPAALPPLSDVASTLEGKKIGPNAPCPCGSGKKYKRCCMNRLKGNPLLN